MSDDSQRPIVIKRIKKGHGGAHGGAWKIAYADFVTAMMAFFLLMWLLSSATKDQLKGISDYFRTPLRVALLGGTGSGDSSSIIKGGGTDLTRTAGQVSKTDQPMERRTINLQASRADVPKNVEANLQSVRSRIQEIIDKSAMLKQFKKQILIDMTNEGLRIQIVDEKGRPVFAGATDRMEPWAKDVIHEIGKVFNEVPNKISVSGHTDATTYQGRPEYAKGNWELSTERANSARRELIYGGMDQGKVVRIQGFGDRVPLEKRDAMDPANRRVALLVLNQKTEQEILNNGLPPEEETPPGVTGPADLPLPEAPAAEDAAVPDAAPAPPAGVPPLAPPVIGPPPIGRLSPGAASPAQATAAALETARQLEAGGTPADGQ